MTYLRFVTGQAHPKTGQRAGLFSAAYRLQESGALGAVEQAEIDELLAWFNDHLSRPARFGRARYPHGISWIRADARVQVQRLYALAELLKRHDHVVEVIRTDKPGFIVYQDEVQAVAEPFTDTIR